MLQKLNYLMDYFKYLDNPIKALEFKFGLKKEFNLKLKRPCNYEIPVDNVFLLNTIMNYIPKIENNEKLNEFFDVINQIADKKDIITINDISYLNLWSKKFYETRKLTNSVCVYLNTLVMMSGI